MNLWIRKIHRWGAVLIALPLLAVIASGLMLQLKKQVPWVQPPTQRGAAGDPRVDWQQILDATRAIGESGVMGWADVLRMDVQPGRGLVKVICRNGWEVQLDLQSAAVLSSTRRRSDWIESLHDGSLFSEAAKLGVFLPNGLVLLGLWFTGLWLWWLPIRSRLRKKQRLAAAGIRPAKPV